jgi:hypothetical protein
MGEVDPIIAFYSAGAPDDRGRRHADILRKDDAWLEYTHDYIQWLFPLPEPSAANPFAPTLSADAIDAFRASPEMRVRLHESFRRMLAFYGLAEANGSIAKGANWQARRDDWFTQPTHNDLRITRILRSLSLLGLRDDARKLMRCLDRLAREEDDCGFTQEALAYWRAAPGTPAP